MDQDLGARRGSPAPSTAVPRVTLNVLAKGTDGLLSAEGIHAKPRRVTIDTGAFVTDARPDIVVGLPERKPNRQCVLQMASGETISVEKEGW
jgi:hypothetical protein